MTATTGYSQISQQYIFHHLGSKEGLLSEETNATVQDASGFIWIAGKNGLQRYDGYRFENFRHVEGDSNSIPHNNISNLVIDKSNRLWLVTADFQLGYFDVDKFRFHKVRVDYNNSLLEKTNSDIQVDADNNILLNLHNYGDSASGILNYDKARDLFSVSDKHFNIPVAWQVHNFSIDSATRNVWFGTSKGLIKYNPVTGNYSYRGHNLDNDPIITALQDYTLVENTLLDKQGNFWMNLSNVDRRNMHLIKFNTITRKITDYYQEIKAKYNNAFCLINSITQQANGAVIITGRNVLIIATEQMDFVPIDMPGIFSIHYDEIKTVFADKEDNTWISSNNGLYRMNLSTATFHYVNNQKYGSNNLSASDVVDFVQLANGNILTATWGNGLYEYDKKFNTVKSEIVSQGDKRHESLIWSVTMTDNGDIWRTQQDGYLYVFHADTRRTEILHEPIFENKTIRQVVKDRNGNLWFSTQAGAVIKWQTKQRNFKLVTRMNFPVFRLYVDKNGDVWAVAESVVKIDAEKDSIVKRFSTGAADNKHLLSGDITDVVQYNDSTFVIASLGLNIVNIHSGHIDYYTTENGLPSDYISNIIFDKNKNLWVITENGICSIDLENKTRSVYGIEDGISNNNATPCSSTMLTDGRILLGTNHNVIVFDPEKVSANTPPQTKILITGLSVMNRYLPMDSVKQLDKVILSYRFNSVLLRYSTLSFRTKYDIVYKMEGLETNWVNSGGRNEAVYSYLPTGNYVFKVGILDAKGLVRSITSLDFSVSTPFWRSWIFYVALILLAGFVIWWLYRERIDRIKDLLKMRNSIGKELHKEVSTTLKNISVLSEIAAMKADVDLEQSKDYIKEIKLKSRSTVIAMDDVMWSIDPNNDSMTKMIERIYETGDSIRSEYKTAIEIKVADNVIHYDLSMKERLELVIIYKTAITMMVKDMHSSKVHVSFKKENKKLLVALSAENAKHEYEEEIIAKKITEINSRAASINCSINIRSENDSLELTAVMRH